MWLDVRKVQEIDYASERNKSGWDELIISKTYKTMLLSLIRQHMSGSVTRDQKSTGPSGQIDIITGKGTGLIVHLHGPSGTGKKNTVESIAAYIGRPLYSITCGDIGLTPTDVMENLEKHSRLAKKWDCVFVLYEADLFLERRNLSDLTRNALVSGE